MNLNNLNQILFKTLDDLENDKIDVKKAQSIVNVSNAINNNSKLMLEAAKFAKNPNILNLIADEDKHKELEYKDLYTQKTDFAISKGYANVAEAIGAMGRDKFNREFKFFSE